MIKGLLVVNHANAYAGRMEALSCGSHVVLDIIGKWVPLPIGWRMGFTARLVNRDYHDSFKRSDRILPI
jgi:hypothetical protein